MGRVARSYCKKIREMGESWKAVLGNTGTYYVPGIILGPGNTKVNKRKENPCSPGAFILLGEDDKKQVKYIVSYMVIKAKEKNKLGQDVAW